MLAGLEAVHRQQPLAEGVPLEEARTRWWPRTPAAIVDRVVAELTAAGRVVARDTLALAGHAVALSPEETEVLERLEARVRDAGLQPPDQATLAADLRRPPAVVERVLRLLLKRKRLVRLDTLVFHQEALERLKAEIAARQDGGTRRPGHRGRAGVQGRLRRHAEVRDTATRIPGQGTCDATGRGRAGRALTAGRRISPSCRRP